MVMGIDSESSSNIIDLTQEDQMELAEDNNTSPSPSWSAPANDYLRQVATKALALLPDFDTIEEPYQENHGNGIQDQPEATRHIDQDAPASEAQNLGGGARSLASSYKIAPATSTSVLHLPVTDPQAVDSSQADKEIPKGGNGNKLRPKAPPQTTFAPPRKRPTTMDQEPVAKKSKLSNPGSSVTQSPQTNISRHSVVYQKQLDELRTKLKEAREKLQHNKHSIDKRDKELQIMLMQIDMEKLMVLHKAQLQCDAAHDPGQSGKVELGLSNLETMPGSHGSFEPLPRPSVFMLRQLNKFRAELQDLEPQLDAKAGKTTSFEMVDEIRRAVDLRFFIQELEGHYKADREREEDIRRKREGIEREDVSVTGIYQQVQPLAMSSPTHSAAESSTSRSASTFSDTQSDASFGEHVRGSSKPSLPTMPEQPVYPQVLVESSNAYVGSESGQRRSQRLRKAAPKQSEDKVGQRKPDSV
ncbi:hypothetical protein VPNG_07502 [Cytospora leucostoma]|uniref:Uncharacterized protein n=1 Tax=Cytospora leucostoma TaxID=1230097 RepID=A0A423WSP2_9PEZI|nr:hypothetical protein VPNG_07502 [Cytospora leucostoma]